MPDSGGGDTAELRVARATPGDAAAIQSVRIDAWRTAYRDVLPAAFLASLDAEQGIQALSDHLNRQSEKYFALVCRFDGELSGFAMLGAPRFEAEDGVVELRALNVRPSHWRRGGASALIDSAVQESRGMAYQRMELWVIEQNPRARSVYERRGFTCSDLRRTTTALTGHPLTEIHYFREL